MRPSPPCRLPTRGAHLQWNRSGGQGETWLINHMGGGTADAGIRFAGITTSTGITPTEWARFLNNGNFGIGTTAPSAKLDVDGSTRLRGLTTAGVVTTDASGNLSSATATSLDPTTASNGLTKVGNDFRLGGTLAAATTIAQGGNAFSLTGTGNVGIGTTAPLQKLEVVGGIRASGNAAFTAVSGTNEGAHLQWNRSGGQGETWLINHLGGGTADAGIRFAGVTTSTGTTPTEWARFLNNGNFGIGTTAPTQKLDVRGNLRLGEDGGAVTGTGNVVEFIGPGINTDPIGLYRINTASDASELRVVVGDNLDVNDKFSVGRTTTSTEGTLATGTFTSVFTVRADGNVGIGTISPATRLDVNGNLRLAVRLCPVNTGGTYTLVAADVAFSIFKTQIGNAVSTITLPGSIGQVEGQELTIINASDTNVIVNGSTDNGGGATLPNANGPGLHAVKYVWATYSGGTGVWFRVQ